MLFAALKPDLNNTYKVYCNAILIKHIVTDKNVTLNIYLCKFKQILQFTHYLQPDFSLWNFNVDLYSVKYIINIIKKKSIAMCQSQPVLT